MNPYAPKYVKTLAGNAVVRIEGNLARLVLPFTKEGDQNPVYPPKDMVIDVDEQLKAQEIFAFDKMGNSNPNYNKERSALFYKIMEGVKWEKE